MFITLEGPDGSGKTCQIPGLADFLRQRGYDVLTTREPGGTGIGDQVRNVLMNLDNTAMHPRTEILLFQSSRAQLVHEVIVPNLEAGKVVICDRYADSTLAYQGYGHQTDMQALHNIVNFATGGLKPDLTILFDIDAETGLRRRSADGDWNRLDAYALAFHERVRAGYHTMAAAEPERWLTLDATQSIEDVQTELRRLVLSRLEVATQEKRPE
ncbi:MAG: dTMP kinase [Anaerolineales bacterium]|nr:dTMP kinase [Anaerolineales bacterium]